MLIPFIFYKIAFEHPVIVQRGITICSANTMFKNHATASGQDRISKIVEYVEIASLLCIFGQCRPLLP